MSRSTDGNKENLIRSKKIQQENLRLNHILASRGYYEHCSISYKEKYSETDWKNFQMSLGSKYLETQKA